MVDLQMMDAVLDALPAGAPLILIGDAHQLPRSTPAEILADLAQLQVGGRPFVAVLEHGHRMEPAARSSMPPPRSGPVTPIA